MMIGHLTFAGLAEAVISAGLVAYLQVADPSLLQATSGLALASVPAGSPPTPRSLQRLWLTIAVLMLLTPLGILAAGTAWGEWSPSELVKSPPAAIGASSPAAPAGLQRWSNLWTAPFPYYAPTFVRSRAFGYLLSAMFGVGLLLTLSLLMRRLLDRNRGKEYAP
jgi:cobalt/nickel transport system permease protein